MRLSCWLAPILFLPALAFAESSVYRWVDGAGQVHFSQTPPPADNHYDVIRGKKAASTTPASAAGASSRAASETRTREQEFIKNAEAERKAKSEAKEKAKTAKAESEKKCALAQERKSFLEERTARRLVSKADDGNYGRMTEDDFLKELDTAKKDVSANCH